jgi:sulfur-oxidizing protein SoxX
MTRYIILALTLFVITTDPGLADDGDALSDTERGRQIAFERRKGNCLACHVIEGGELAGNYGPPLVMMKARFPDREVLREQVRDAEVSNPDTRMPPFGRHKILTEEEIDLVVDFLLTL